jgi:abhydrolase domain-containing protein 14
MNRIAIGLLAALAGFSPVPAAAQDDGVVPVESRELRLNGARIHFLEAGRGETVLLLHGMRYSAQTWRELGTLELLAREGYRAVALDLPGFGESDASEAPVDRFLASLLPLIADRPVVVVSPSMSGRFSFPLLLKRPSFVLGFVPIAPAELAEYLDQLRGRDLPALVVWGENDEIVPPRSSRALAEALPNSRRVEIPGAGHACYLDQPQVFHRELLLFLKGLFPEAHGSPSGTM